jgi:hypothetical protein
MNLLISLRSEILKTKRTASLYLTIAAAGFGPFASMLDIIFDGIDEDNRAVLFSSMMIKKFEMVAFLVFPIFLILICTLLPQIEFKNNGWKQVLASPQTKGTIFLSKFMNVQLLILVFLFTSQVLMFAATVILHFMEPSLNVLYQPVNWWDALMNLINSYVAMMALCAIQFWLGLRFKNFIIPIAIGVGLWFAGSILAMEAKSPLAEYFPYSFHVLSSFEQFRPKDNIYQWVSAGYAVAFLLIGFIDFRKMGKR